MWHVILLHYFHHQDTKILQTKSEMASGCITESLWKSQMKYMCVTEIHEYCVFVKAKQELLDLLSAGNKAERVETNSSITYNKKQNMNLKG